MSVDLQIGQTELLVGKGFEARNMNDELFQREEDTQNPVTSSDDSNSRDTNSDSDDGISNSSKNNDNCESGYLRSEYTPNSWTPWVRQPYKASMDGLHHEIEDFVQWVSPTTEERKMRNDLVSRIDCVVQELWKGARVEVIGSYKTELCVPTSDIDLVIFGASKDPSDLQPLFLLSSALEDYRISRGKVKVITTAKVPIIKFKDFIGGCSVDVAFEINTGLENTKIVQSYLNDYPLLRPLTLIIKYYLKQCGMNDTWSGGIGSYTLVILITSYLQKHTTLKGQTTSEDENLAHLLIGFFEFYGSKFDYETQVISVKDNCYYTKRARRWYNDLNPGLLSVEDPLYPDVDVGSASFQIATTKQSFEEAHHILTSAMKNISQGSLLNWIIQQSFTYYVLQFRDRIRIAYGGSEAMNTSLFAPTRKNFSKKGCVVPQSAVGQGRYFKGRRYGRNFYDENKNHYEKTSRKFDTEEFPSLSPVAPQSKANTETKSNPLGAIRRSDYSEVVSNVPKYYSKSNPKSDKSKFSAGHPKSDRTYFQGPSQKQVRRTSKNGYSKQN